MLTDREQEVLRLRAKGLTQTVVAQRLHITQAADSAFERNALRKIRDAESTVQAAKDLGVSPS